MLSNTDMGIDIELYFSEFAVQDTSEIQLNTLSEQLLEQEFKLGKILKLEQSEILRDLLKEITSIILHHEFNIKELLHVQDLSILVEVSLVSASAIRQINFETRNIAQTTDVLSFPNFAFETIQKSKLISKCELENFDFQIEPYAWLDPTAVRGTISLGEIVICLQKTQEQAAELEHTLIREFCFLYMHGLLHLCGYDHQTEKDAELMFSLQREILPDLEKLILNSDFAFN